MRPPASARVSNVYIGRSPIAGRGVFAARRLRAGELILSFAAGGPAVVPCAATHVAPQGGGHYLQVGEDRYILPRPPALYVNHSCDPNAGVRDCTELVALTAIESGAEVTFDYSTSMAEDGWEMDCTCRAAACRGRVRDFKHLPPERRAFYMERGVVGAFCVEGLFTPAR